jgi:asparagine synthase (glutamine-hydrolysing)
MCGIAGILSLSDRPANAGLVAPMLERLAHRGPDDEGCADLGRAALGMRRLSILDPTPRGHQPMTSPDGRYTVVHNGEIYNFLELADELAERGRNFATQSDTEVILAAYAAWGPDCVERFNGIWAFAIWDAHEEHLFLARDRLGVKPLFLAEGAGTLAFASEIKALRTLPWVSDDPEPVSIRDFLVAGTVDRGNRTFLRDITRFPAAHTLLQAASHRRLRRYWTPTAIGSDTSFRPDSRDAERVDTFRALLIDAVALQLRTDVPIGSCLSGGIDSSSIVSIAAAIRREDDRVAGSTGRGHREREGTPQLAFFAEFREAGTDERPYVDAVVEATGVELRTTTPDRADFLTTLDAVLDAQDEPFGSLSIIAQYHVMKLARESGVKVLLDGQGADELLGGYRNYVGVRLAGALRSGRRGAMLDAGRALVRAGGPFVSTLGHSVLGDRRLPARLIRGGMPAGWLGPATRVSRPSEPERGPSDGTLLARRLWRETADDNLPGLLRYEDRNSMAFGIEARVPFLDHRLVEMSLALPDRLRIAGPGNQKSILHRAMVGIVPDLVLARRDKVAFQPPEDRWLRESLQTWRGLADASTAEADGFLARNAIGAALGAFEAGRIGSSVLWRTLNLELWLRRRSGSAA